jgi:hypothetical protein
VFYFVGLWAVLGQKNFFCNHLNDLISNGHCFFTGFLCGCIGGIFPLLKCFPVIFPIVFQFLLSEESTQSRIYWQILCICPFDNLYVIHLKSPA